MTIDGHIQDRVLAALECEPSVRAEEIGVTTLRGGVTTLREKFLAERIARRLPLVRPSPTISRWRLAPLVRETTQRSPQPQRTPWNGIAPFPMAPSRRRSGTAG